MTIFKSLETSLDLDYPTINPTLDLNFPLTKTLDPRITFTRNSIGTYVGSDGYIKTAVANEPRFDHDPITGKCLGLMIEEQRTNLLRQSIVTPDSGGTYTFWTPEHATITPNDAIAPDGTNTAALIRFNGNGTVGKVRRYESSLGNTSGLTESIWVRAKTGTVTIQLDFGNFRTFGTEWTRIKVENKPSSPNYFFSLIINNEFNSPYEFYAWGAQTELGSYPTSYIPTSGSTVTRLADSATITGTNFSSWYNTSEGTLLSVGEPISSNISSNTSLNIIPSYSSTRTVSNLLYYPKVIQYATLKSMNANGYSYPSPISTTGLLLNLDAGNTQSYSGSGSTWFDLSGNSRNFTLNNPSYYSFSSFNSGSIGFTRTLPPTAEIGGYAEHTASGNLAVGNYLYNDHTTEIWARINDRNPTNYDASETQGALFVYVGYHSMFYYGSTGLSYNIWNSTSGQVSSPSLTLGTSGTDIIQGQWFHVVAVRNGNNLSSYINGNLKGTNVVSPPTNTGQTTNIIRMGMASDSGGQFSWHINANVSAARMYNRALSASEVQQNFNALRGRYGI